MFSLIRKGQWPGLLIDEGPAFIGAMIIAELFFKFHSFVLESIAFLAVWYVFGAVAHAIRRRTAEREE